MDTAENPDLPSLKNILQLKKRYDAPPLEELPASYKSNSDKERLHLWAAQNFEGQIRQKYPRVKPHCLVCKNECGIEKLIITFIKVRESAFLTVYPWQYC